LSLCHPSLHASSPGRLAEEVPLDDLCRWWLRLLLRPDAEAMLVRLCSTSCARWHQLSLRAV
jgi:hypothetical protein